MDLIFMGNKVYLLFGAVVVCFALFYFISRMLKGTDKVIDKVTDPAKLYEMANEFAEQGKFKKAVKYCRKAAEQGDKDAQFNLGQMYYQGQGVPQDDKAAFRYYKLAAEQGDELAISMLEILKGEINTSQDP
jgi:TPR repeat protein